MNSLCIPSSSPTRSSTSHRSKWIAAVAMIGLSMSSMAQVFSGAFTFGADGNVSSFDYNGTLITGLTVSPITKVGITSSASNGNFRGSQWPTGATTDSDAFTGSVNTGKFIEFTFTAAPGKFIDLPTINFGLGRSGTGPRQWQWRSSVDNFTNPIPVTTVNQNLTHAAGVLTNTDLESSSTGNVITTSTEAYRNLSSITFRLYGYNSEGVIGTGGLQGNLTFGGTLTNANGSLTVTVNPSTFPESASNPAATGTVTRTGDISSALLVSLSSSDLTEATVPATVQILANQTEATFPVTAVDDEIADGSQSVLITASATAYTKGHFILTVNDNEVIPALTLSPGAIAFVGFNADADKDLAFVALAPIAGGVVIHFTDNEWNGQPLGSSGAFIDTNEGVITWTAPLGGVSVGTVVTLNNLTGTINGPSSNFGSVTRSAGNFNMGAENESVYAFQGNAATLGASGFVAAITHHTDDSFIGTGLSGPHIVDLPTDKDVAVYIGSHSSQTSFAAYLDLIVNTTNNWITQDGDNDQSNDGTAPDLPFDTTSFTLAGGGGNTFVNWIGNYAVDGQNGFNGDFDNDGLGNAMENILGSSPMVAGQGLTAVSASSGNLVFRHTRSATPAPDLTASYEWSTNLANWNASGASAGGTTVTFGAPAVITPGTPDLIQVTATVTGTPSVKIFARLKVAQN